MDDVTFSKTGSGPFTVSPTTLTAEEVMAGATITVTYAPTNAGSHTANINVTSSGAETKTVSVQGTATNVRRIVCVKYETIHFTRTINMQGQHG